MSNCSQGALRIGNGFRAGILYETVERKPSSSYVAEISRAWFGADNDVDLELPPRGLGRESRRSTEAEPVSVLLDTDVVSIFGRFRRFLSSKITSSPPNIASCAIGPIPTCS